MMNLRRIYILTAALTLVVYIAGILTGWMVAGSSLQSFENDLRTIKSDLESAQQELLLLSARDVAGCAVIASLATDITGRLGRVVEQLLALEGQGQSQTASFTELKKTYIELSVRAWILRNTLNKNCAQTVLPILYYYSVPCEPCLEQGKALDAVRSTYGPDIAVYVIDRGFDHPLVSTLAASHGINQTPALVIGEDTMLGLVPAERLSSLVCTRLNITRCLR